MASTPFGGDLELARKMRDEFHNKSHGSTKRVGSRGAQPATGHGSSRGAQSPARSMPSAPRPRHMQLPPRENAALEARRQAWAAGIVDPAPLPMNSPLSATSLGTGLRALNPPLLLESWGHPQPPIQTRPAPTPVNSANYTFGAVPQDQPYSGPPSGWISIRNTVPPQQHTMAVSAHQHPVAVSVAAPAASIMDAPVGPSLGAMLTAAPVMQAAAQLQTAAQLQNAEEPDLMDLDGNGMNGNYSGGPSPPNDLLTESPGALRNFPALQPAPPNCICEQYQVKGLAESVWNRDGSSREMQNPFTHLRPSLRQVRCGVHGELQITELRDLRGEVRENTVTRITRPRSTSSPPLDASAPVFTPRKKTTYKPTAPNFTPGSATSQHVPVPGTYTEASAAATETPRGFQLPPAGRGLAASRWA